MRALAASPAARFADARAFAAAIDFAQRDVVAVKRTSAPRRAMEAVPRHPLAWAGSIAVIVAAGALAATPIRTALHNRSSGGSESARSSVAAGMDALQRWDLATAEQQLTAAASADPKLAQAQLGLAHTLELERRIDSDAFRLAAARLAPLAGTLHGRDSLLAQAMAAFAAKAYPRACEAFRAMRAADSLDAMAWFGLGDCLSLDSVVVRDSRTRSGWAFRTSWDAAVKAYVRATTLDPGAHRALPYNTLVNLLVTTPTKVRFGRSEASHGIAFAAHGELLGDTVAFTPFPVADIVAARPQVLSTTLTELVRRQREALVAFARQWVAAAPRNIDALEALASGYESRGELDDRTGALSVLREARALASTPGNALRIAAMEVRIRVKLGDFARAQAAADSVLRVWRGKTASAGDASRLAGFAALTGHLADGTAWRVMASVGDNASQGIAPALTEAESRLFLRAASGVCDDSLIVQRDRLDGLLESYAQPNRRSAVRTMLLARPMQLAYPCIGERAFTGIAPTMPLDRAQRAAAAKDRRRALAILDSLDRVRALILPGEVSLDHSVQEAWIRAALRDSTEAARRLDRILDALPTLGPWAVREEAQAAAVGRALLLRAELAATLGQDEQRRLRAQQALALWRSADPAFAPVVARLRSLASLR
jgi:tetratricopeptide (TPR) repeat protein